MDLNLSTFYFSLLTLMLIIILGFILGKIGLISPSTNKQLVNLLLMVFMPAALFNAFPADFSEESAGIFFAGLAAGFIIMLVMIVVSKILFHRRFYKGELSFEAQFAFIFNNATFLGYPLISTTFGEQGVLPYCGFIVAFNLALFSYGIYLFEKKITTRFFKEVATNPNIIAVLLGMVLFFLSIHLPDPVTSAVGYVASATTPLSLICIGYMLSRAHLRDLLRRWKLLIIASLQLILAPLLAYFLLSFMHFPQEVVVVCSLLQALPTATSLGLFAEKYGGNDVESSELVIISTLLSCATLPLMVLMIFQ